MGENMGRMRQFRTGSFSGMCVLYWMVRDKRVRDNWALLEAQKKAEEERERLEKEKLEAHKAIFNLLKHEMKEKIHALEIEIK